MLPKVLDPLLSRAHSFSRFSTLIVNIHQALPLFLAYIRETLYRLRYKFYSFFFRLSISSTSSVCLFACVINACKKQHSFNEFAVPLDSAWIVLRSSAGL